MHSTRSPLGYVPALDGLRAVAIGAVMVYHAHASWLPGGFLGVDVFFVLSGFLITSLLLCEFDATHWIALRHFYLRRVLWLGPALVLLLVTWAGLTLVLLTRLQAYHHLVDTGIALAYFTNWSWAFNLHVHQPHLLAHTWSLSIEEQFYLLWPLLLLVLLRSTRSRCQIVCVLALGVVAAWLLRLTLALNGASVSRLCNGLDTRADGLLIGCLVGVLVSSDVLRASYRRFAHVLPMCAPLCALGLVAFGVMTPSYHTRQMYYWGLDVAAVLTAVLLLDICVSPRSVVRCLLTTQPLVWVGRGARSQLSGRHVKSEEGHS